MTLPSCMLIDKLQDDCYNWNVRFQHCCDQAASMPVDILFIGDSITHFWMPPSPGCAHSYGGSVWNKYFDRPNVLNIGFGWDRTCNVLWRLENGNFPAHRPGVVVLNIGTNNLSATDRWHGDDPEEAAAGVLAVIEKIHDISPESRVISMAVFPRGDDGDPMQLKVDALNAAVDRDTAGLEYVIRLDLRKEFIKAGRQVMECYCRDRVHLASPGYEAWAAALIPMLRTELQDR